MSKSKDTLLSIAIPVYRADTMLETLCQQLTEVIQNEPYSLEIILIEDYSPDDSWRAILSLCRKYEYIKGVKLSRNFGQQIAVSAGIANAKGKYVIVMDCDLQNPPSAILQILRKLEAGNDLVYTVAKQRNNAIDELTSRLFWFVLTKVLKVDIVTNQLMMRGMSERFVKYYGSYSEVTRSVAGISLDIGLKSSIVIVENQQRHSGKSNYNFFKRFNLMIDIVLSLSTTPLTMIINVSILVLLGTLLATLYYLYVVFFLYVPAGFTSIILLILGFGSLITLILGVLGVYLANIYKEVRHRPLFIIDEKVNFCE
jgi:glycosyltransferase involved in cell wall biosynthesis